MQTDNQAVDLVESHALSCLPATLQRLVGYLKIPAISCDVNHHADVAKLARRIADDVAELGFERARVVELDGALPLVAAEWLKAGPDKPTLLIYGHFDLQPVKGESWTHPPHEPLVKEGRLFARGSADDMGGWVSHLAALEAWLSVTGALPCNVKLVIEGEEEIGSPNLERYMDAEPSAFEADVMVLTDCENPSTDIPGLTKSLRGLYEVELTCEALASDVHSGLWGNLAPDAGNALVLLLARLLDENGRFRLGRIEVPEAEAKKMFDVPLDSGVIREGTHMLDGVEPLPLEGRSAAEWLWRQPAVTVLSTTFPRADQHKNAIRGRASAVLSLRVAPGQTHAELRALLDRELLRYPPGGVKVTLTERSGWGESWLYDPKGPAFEAADRAYTKAWGRPLLPIGIGGSIPFVALFGRRYADLPLILNGVLDPLSGAHGPDESLHLGVFEKAITANVHLVDQLSRERGLLSR
jgi:acetylornithine deacetylase/succinyl-diaminopimelate desuccinylase-like protein